jgi:hypothetical protein
MDKLKTLPKQYLIIGGVIVILLTVVAAMTFSGKKSNNEEPKETVFEEPQDAIPTVDSSVKVTIEGRKEGVITIDGVPTGTTQIEYQLTYNKKNLVDGEGLQDGLFGRIKIKNNEKKVEEKVTFGTCSSGVCRYHDIDGPVAGVFRFTGSYGKRILEKNFNLE